MCCDVTYVRRLDVKVCLVGTIATQIIHTKNAFFFPAPPGGGGGVVWRMLSKSLATLAEAHNIAPKPRNRTYYYYCCH